MPDQKELERQIRWEISGVDRGVERYREAAAETALPDTDPGKRMMTDVLGNLIPAIKAAQEEACDGLTKPTAGRGAVWWAPIICLEADKLALITARSALGRNSRDDGGDKVTPIATEIARNVKLQREFDLWKEGQYEAEKGGAVNLFKVMTSRVRKIDARSARKWMKKAETFDKLEWDLETKILFGTKLIKLLVDHGGGYFMLDTVPSSGSGRRVTERVLKLTPLADEYITTTHAECELNRPWLLPMLCPPAPWCAQTVQETTV